MELGVVGGARVARFFADYLSHVLLSRHGDSFSKYDKRLFLYGLPTSALMPRYNLPHPWYHLILLS